MDENRWATPLRDIRPCSFFSNLTVNGGNIMLLAPFPSSPRSRSMAVLFNLNIDLTSDHVYWDMVGYLQICWKPDSHPSIFGLRNKTLLVMAMGGTGDLLTTNTKVCVFKRWISGIIYINSCVSVCHRRSAETI